MRSVHNPPTVIGPTAYLWGSEADSILIFHFPVSIQSLNSLFRTGCSFCYDFVERMFFHELN